MNDQKFLLDISWTTILKIVTVVFSFYFIYLVGDILIWFLFALVISLLLNPIVDFLEAMRMPRFVSIVLLYCFILGFIGLLIVLMVPIFTFEARSLIEFSRTYFDRLSPLFRGLGIQAFENIEIFIATLGETLTKAAADIFSAIFAIFGGVIATAFVVMMGIFLSLEKTFVEKIICLFFPEKYEKQVLVIWKKSCHKISSWFLSRVLACFFVGAASFLVFWLLDIKYPLSLSFINGVLNFVPFLGPLIAGVIIFLVSALDSLFLAIFVVLAIIMIQLIENNLLSPILAKKFVGLSMTMSLLALVIGAKLWGLLGAVLIIPLVAFLFEFIKGFLELRRAKSQTQTEILPDDEGSMIDDKDSIIL